MQATSLETTNAEQTSGPDVRRQFYSSRLRRPDQKRSKLKVHFCHKVLRAYSLWIKDFYSFATQDVKICKGIPSQILPTHRVWTHFLRNA